MSQLAFRSRLSDWLGWSLLVLSVSSCSESQVTIDPETNQASFNIPTDLPILRAVNPANVLVSVSLNFQPIDMSTVGNDSNRWTGTMDVARNEQYKVEVQWSEQYQNNPLVLGTAEEYVTVVGAAPVNVVFNENNIDVSTDSDRDGWFNVVERERGTEPGASGDPGTSPPNAILTVQFPVPDPLAQLSATDFARAVVRLSVNGFNTSVNAANGTYRGTSLLPVPVDYPAFVTATWFTDRTQTQRLARVAKNFTIPADAVLNIDSADFRVDYDADGNGVSNLQELLGN